ncbi:acyltransferase [Pseudidiomarina sp. YC-516-91]|uniref:acyltransferase n=1 Tax=Pseudidiomarina salilacus TaxID=3384452 RepID=UPI0039850CBA
MSFMTQKELEALGFESLGKNVLISSKASFYNCARIAIGDNTRIDDFTVISAGECGISIGSHVHIAVFSLLIGSGKITVDDFAGISSRVSIYSSNDDYSGNYLTNPTIPSSFTNVSVAPVRIGRHVIIGSGSVVLPGVHIDEGGAIGALSLVTKNCEKFTVYVGNPLKRLKARSQKLLEVEREFLLGLNESRYLVD